MIVSAAVVLAAPSTAAGAAIDINGAHSTNLHGECHPDDGKTCAYVVSQWSPGPNGPGQRLPFESAGVITRVKMPFSGPSVVRVRVVRRVSPPSEADETFRVVHSSPPIRVRRKGWLNARVHLRVRAGDAIAIGLRGEGGPSVVYVEGGNGPSGGEGKLRYVHNDSADKLSRARYPCCGGEDSDGLSMVLTLK